MRESITVHLVGPFSLLRKCLQSTPHNAWQSVRYSINTIYDDHHQTQSRVISCKVELQTGGPRALSSKCLLCLNMFFNDSPVKWWLPHLESNDTQKSTGCSTTQVQEENNASTVTLRATGGSCTWRCLPFTLSEVSSIHTAFRQVFLRRYMTSLIRAGFNPS